MKMVRCPSADAHKLFEGQEPSELEEDILALLEAAGIPSKISDQIMMLVAKGEAILYHSHPSKGQ